MNPKDSNVYRNKNKTNKNKRFKRIRRIQMFIEIKTKQIKTKGQMNPKDSNVYKIRPRRGRKKIIFVIL